MSVTIRIISSPTLIFSSSYIPAKCGVRCLFILLDFVHLLPMPCIPRPPLSPQSHPNTRHASCGMDLHLPDQRRRHDQCFNPPTIQPPNPPISTRCCTTLVRTRSPAFTVQKHCILQSSTWDSREEGRERVQKWDIF